MHIFCALFLSSFFSLLLFYYPDSQRKRQRMEYFSVWTEISAHKIVRYVPFNNDKDIAAHSTDTKQQNSSCIEEIVVPFITINLPIYSTKCEHIKCTHKANFIIKRKQYEWVICRVKDTRKCIHNRRERAWKSVRTFRLHIRFNF